MPQPTLHIIQRVTYAIAGQTVAVRVTGDPTAANNGLFYLYSDHLGSTSAIQNSIGGTPTINRYLPFGDYRPGSAPNDITDLGYTGQKENMELGLYYYNARYYSPNTNRWLSPDTIVPDPTNPQSLNRYSYVYNNPLNYADPSGHDGMWCNDPYEGDAGCNSSSNNSGTQYDLTGWLPGAMRRGAQAEELDPMREAFINAATSRLQISQEYWQVRWGIELATTFKDLNTGYGQWDIKREMNNQLQDGIILCSGTTCRWVDYSVPGNILYGYVAASTGVSENLSRLAGGGLEVWEGTAKVANWVNAFEDPYDSAAVGFGYQLYADYGPDITEEEFNNALTVDILDSFQPPPDGFIPPFSPIPQSNSYPVGAFDCVSENGCVTP